MSENVTTLFTEVSGGKAVTARVSGAHNWLESPSCDEGHGGTRISFVCV